jgi:hypothetical protein
MRQRKYELGQTGKTLNDNLRFVKDKRIEIDSIQTAIGANKLWKFILSKLARQYPIRDYNRAIEIKEFVYPSVFYDFNYLLKDRLKTILKDDVNDTKKELKTHDGIMNDINEEENNILDNFTDTVDNDKSLKSIRENLQKMVDKLLVDWLRWLFAEAYRNYTKS